MFRLSQPVAYEFGESITLNEASSFVRKRGQEFFVIISGSASVDRGGVHLADVGPGDFQGEIALLDGGPRTATVTATTPMKLLVATHREFSSLLDTTPLIARRMLPALAHRVRAPADDTP
jgi:CRP/FNR family transcriptional regulator, cyclic AMP receptor protein